MNARGLLGSVAIRSEMFGRTGQDNIVNDKDTKEYSVTIYLSIQKVQWERPIIIIMMMGIILTIMVIIMHGPSAEDADNVEQLCSGPP